MGLSLDARKLAEPQATAARFWAFRVLKLRGLTVKSQINTYTLTLFELPDHERLKATTKIR